MALPQEVTGKPPAGVGFFSVLAGSNSLYGGVSATDAWENAVAHCGDYPATYTSGSSDGAFGELENSLSGATTYHYAFFRKCKYRFALLSATCYCRIDWDEVVRTVADDLNDPWTVVSTTSRNYLWTPPSNNGLCVPEGFQTLPPGFGDGVVTLDPTTFFLTPETELIPPQPPAPPPGYAVSVSEIIITNLRWTFLEDYVAPVDGSANGFPVR